MDSDGFAGSLIIIAFVIIKAFLAAGEYAVTEINDSKVKGFENGTKREKRLYKLLQSPSRLRAAFSVNRIFFAVVIAYASLLFCENEYGGDLIIKSLIIFLPVIFVLAAFGEALPRRLAASADIEKLALFSALPIKIMMVLLTPLTVLADGTAALLSRLSGSKASGSKETVTEEEILMMVDAGNETGVIEESQKEMINNVFGFNDLAASDVMTHRTDIAAVEKETPITEVVNLAISSGFSRIPVYENTVDHIIGIICVKDLLCMVGSDAASTALASDFIRDIIYVPETIPCGELFEQLSDKKMQMAAVADEYGGTAGIVTMEDLVESIVGNIQDEYDNEAEELIRISDDTYTIDGTAEPEHILREFGITLPEDNDFDTMSGFIVNLLGRIPEENENPSVKYGNVTFTVLITEDMCITKLKATLSAKNESDNENENENENNLKENFEENEHQEKN